MKHIISTIVIIALSVIVWLKWGGIHNDMGTLVILMADTFAFTVMASNRHDEKVKKSEKNLKG